MYTYIHTYIHTYTLNPLPHNINWLFPSNYMIVGYGCDINSQCKDLWNVIIMTLYMICHTQPIPDTYLGKIFQLHHIKHMVKHWFIKSIKFIETSALHVGRITTCCIM